jgi:rhodanese-related sulfurtransferase
VDVHEAKKLLEFQQHVVLDARSAREYDREHITKPPKSCFSVPFSAAAAAAGPALDGFGAAAEKALGRGKARGVLVMTADGGDADAAAAAVAAAGYTAVAAVQGGWGAHAHSSLCPRTHAHARAFTHARCLSCFLSVCLCRSGVAAALHCHVSRDAAPGALGQHRHGGAEERAERGRRGGEL